MCKISYVKILYKGQTDVEINKYRSVYSNQQLENPIVAQVAVKDPKMTVTVVKIIQARKPKTRFQ